MNINYIAINTLIVKETKKMFRTSVQSLVGPWVSAILFIVIFGSIVGSKITFLSGQFSYIEFVFPGVLTLNFILASFRQTLFSLYLQRFTKNIEEVLAAPISNFDLIFSFLFSALVRTVVIGLGIYAIALIFGIGEIKHVGWFIFYLITITITFGSLGLVTALWSGGWEQLSLFEVFAITPLTFLGGMFTSLEMVNKKFQWIFEINPFFYFIDGVRYSMINCYESNPTVRIILVLTCTFFSLIWCSILFKSGYKIRP